MPIYEFKCKNCGNIFEYLCLKSSDKDNASCPSCGRKETDVLLSAFSSLSSSNSQGGGARLSSSSCSPSGGFS
ncbi:MAG: zinc ribbon domain-containing protein [Deltaproteobacteria bacterium]|nr:zinc ribbon domain-containing protein [Deltaproteobacteria bacterium]MBW1737440.1 zinc ribbon domain-containing protein [Deltaproteobacteria bacterium]MBW1909390.1 zinc ribbon domain-containing protein [Deltaproteobacteria bacterium]MBW2032757.1 zinc ribbon domain-containing protein [Deltaproteobacteria bacterium]MBW2114979.1 zinc ribbon domain-containing protein [Deltaproteobacteria bacterium]